MEQTKEERRKTQSSNAIAENMRAKEAHKYLGIGLSTLWLFVKTKKIPAYKLSDKVTIFKKEDLDRFVNEAVEVVS
jgi:excisionase family DNA binding protein